MIRTRWTTLLLLLTVLMLTACGGGTTPSTGGTATEPPADSGGTESTESPAPEEDAGGEETAEGEQPLFVYVAPNPLGVNQFLIMGQTGLEQVAAQYNAEVQVLESEDPTTRAENVRAAVSDGAEVVMVLGFEFADILAEVAPEAPDTEFLIVDQCIENPPPNVHCAVFREHEAAYLIGVVAASLTESDHVGAIGALDIPFLHRYTDAFAEGARSVNPGITVDTLWVGGDNPFADPARAKEQALAMAANGADHIFAAAAAGNLGVFEAAGEQDFFSYGVDVNQCPDAPGHVVENLIKRVDVAVVESVTAIMEGADGNILEYGVAEGGVGLVSLNMDAPEDSQCVIMEHADVIEQVRAVADEIASGEVTVTDPMAAQ